MEGEDDPHDHYGRCCVVGRERDRAFSVYEARNELESKEVRQDIKRFVEGLLNSDDPHLRNINIVVIGEYKLNSTGSFNFEVEVYSKNVPCSVIKAREIYNHLVKNMNEQFDAQRDEVSLESCDGDSCVRIGKIVCRKKIPLYEVADQKTAEELTKRCLFNAYSKEYPDAGRIREMKKYI